MIITDVNCDCGASYRCAQSSTLNGAPGEFYCVCCGALVERWADPHERAYRLITPIERLYVHPKVPPSPWRESPPVVAEAAGG